MYTAGWPVMSTPLDTCGVAVLVWPSFNAWVSVPTRLATVLARAYLYWVANCDCWWQPGNGTHTDVWYDVVAVYLATLPPAWSSDASPPPSLRKWVELQSLNITVTGEGYTVVDPRHVAPVVEAVRWVDRDAFLMWVGDTIASQ